MYNNNDDVLNFEKFPGSQAESAGERRVPPEQDFEKAMTEEVPEFAGFGGEKTSEVAEKKFGQANPENMYYGESQDDENQEKRDEGIAEASRILDLIGNPRMDENGLRIIYEFDVDGAKNPARELVQALGIEGGKGQADSTGELELRSGVDAPVRAERSLESDRQAIKAVQELIGEILDADKDYSELRTSRLGVVEQVASDNRARGVEAGRSANLAEILQGLMEYKKHKTDSKENLEAEENTEVGVDLEAENGVEAAEDAEVAQAEELVDAEGDSNILRPEFGKKDNLEQRVQNGEQLNPEILKKAA